MTVFLAIVTFILIVSNFVLWVVVSDIAIRIDCKSENKEVEE